MKLAMNILGLTIGTICGIMSLTISPAEARRVALVIGNADYVSGSLDNPVNDATSVAEAFSNLRFDTVTLRKNLGAEDFRAALMEMSRASVGAELGVVYFAGHGVEVGGRNYLIPVDAMLARQGDIDLQAIALDTVINQLAGVAGLRLVILDACRNNIFALAGETRAVGRGLARIEPGANTLVAYAAKDGSTAADGAEEHSPFTLALLHHIPTPNLEVRLMFGRVRDEVVQLTRHDAQPQQPYLYGALGGRPYYLRPVDPDGESAEVQRLREQEQEIAKAVAAAKAAEEERRQAERALEAEIRSKVKAIDEAKHRVALATPPPAAAPSSGRTCSQSRARCMENCRDFGGGGGAPGRRTGSGSCDGRCSSKFNTCMQTGVWMKKFGQQRHGMIRR